MFNWFKNLFAKKEEIDPSMKYLIVGLGNMGADYDDTRHNIGFDVVDYMAKEADVKFKNDTLGDLAQMKHKGRFIYLLKPSTYMNLSGKSVRHWMTKLKIQPDNLMIVVDDLHLDFGQLRMRKKGAAGGHNGLKDIEEKLGSSKYPRLKVGIGNEFSKGRQVDYVLGKWTQDERDGLPKILEKSAKACLSFTSIGIAHTMNQFNK